MMVLKFLHLRVTRIQNDADKNKEATLSAIPLSQNADHVHLSRLSNKQSDEKVEAQSLSAKNANKEVYFKESQSLMGSSKSGSYSGKRGSLERIPSSVKDMISAFESNLSQDTKSHIKPSPSTKPQSSEIGSQSKEAKTDNMRKIISPRSKLKFTHEELDIEEEKSSRDSTVMPMIRDKRHSSGSQAKISPENSQILTTRETSTHNLRPMEHNEDMHDSFDSFSAWIFPDQTRRFCVTTGGKKLMDFPGGYGTMKSEVRQKEVNFLIPEKCNDNGGARNEKKRSNKTHKARKSKPETEDVESSRGPVGQVMKVAIMVGFGVLVLLTRQKK